MSVALCEIRFPDLIPYQVCFGPSPKPTPTRSEKIARVVKWSHSFVYAARRYSDAALVADVLRDDVVDWLFDVSADLDRAVDLMLHRNFRT